MLDINFIRDNLDIIKEAARKKHSKIDLDELVRVDDERREKQQVVESLRAEQNRVSKNIATADNEQTKNQLISEMQGLKKDLQERENELKEINAKWQELMLAVPNIPDISVPEGKDESENVTIKTWGEVPEFSFEPKDHVELMTSLNMADVERGVKAHGFRGYYLLNDGAEMSWALWNFTRKLFADKGFISFMAPAVVRKQHFYGTGHLPAEAEDLYATQDDDYLSGTSEVAMMAYHSNETLKKEELPKKMLAFSPCYRREAGSYGRDTKGLIRVHEFYKIEQLVLCEASHEQSVEFHEEINRNFEELIEALKLPYRQVNIAGGELGDNKVKQYDTEIWMPTQNEYRELNSASYYHDYQSRRFQTAYTDDDGKKRFVHSLNATAVATPRVIAAIVENYQNEDGSVAVPEVLQPYLGKQVITTTDNTTTSSHEEHA